MGLREVVRLPNFKEDGRSTRMKISWLDVCYMINLTFLEPKEIELKLLNVEKKLKKKEIIVLNMKVLRVMAHIV